MNFIASSRDRVYDFLFNETILPQRCPVPVILIRKPYDKNNNEFPLKVHSPTLGFNDKKSPLFGFNKRFD